MHKIFMYFIVAVAASNITAFVVHPKYNMQYFKCLFNADCKYEPPEDDVLLPKYEDYQCLRQALFFEIRNGTDKAMQNVADVVINRTNAAGFATDVCSVVKQPYQFSYLNKQTKQELSYNWDKHLSVIDELALKRIDKIAFSTLMHGSKNKQILWYHTHGIKPKWSKKLQLELKDQHHRFFTARQKP